MNQILEQRAHVCFAESRESHDSLQRVEGTINDAYLHRSHYGNDDLGLMFQVSYGMSGGVMRCTDMNAIGVLMHDLGVESDRGLIGKTIQVYLNREGREVALSKYKYDI